MKLEDVRIAKSAISDRVYVGKVSKDGTKWSGDKKDVTSDFYKCVIEMFDGYETDIHSEDGKKYRVVVEEVS